MSARASLTVVATFTISVESDGTVSTGLRDVHARPITASEPWPKDDLAADPKLLGDPWFEGGAAISDLTREPDHRTLRDRAIVAQRLLIRKLHDFEKGLRL